MCHLDKFEVVTNFAKGIPAAFLLNAQDFTKKVIEMAPKRNISTPSTSNIYAEAASCLYGEPEEIAPSSSPLAMSFEGDDVNDRYEIGMFIVFNDSCSCIHVLLEMNCVRCKV